MSHDLLPPNATALDSALATATEFDLPTSGLRGIGASGTCPAPALPWLAWERSVENFDAAATEEKQRALIRSSLFVHQHKGTVAAVREVFRLLGLGEVTIEAGRSGFKRDGSRRRADFYKRGTRADNWAEYRVICYSLLTVQQAATARQLLADIAPASRHLHSIDFSHAALVRNGYGKRNGSYSRGKN